MVLVVVELEELEELEELDELDEELESPVPLQALIASDKRTEHAANGNR